MDDQLTVGSLFAGIGGFDLGFERAGLRTVWFCEQDPFCQRVLARHWPGVPVFDDVRALVADTDSGGLAVGGERNGRTVGPRQQASQRDDVDGRDETAGLLPVPVPSVDVLCGGFPCQDLSVAGKGAGLDGDRSGLWSEYARLIRELRPRYVVVENVAALLARGMGRVLGDLAACGYDAEWDCIPASAVGAPHRRDRVWLVAYPNGSGLEGPGRAGLREEVWAEFAGGREHGALQPPEVVVGDTDAVGRDGRPGQQRPAGRGEPTDAGWWAVEPDVGRVAHGVPQRVDRLRALGNSLVPQIAEQIGRRIVEWER